MILSLIIGITDRWAGLHCPLYQSTNNRPIGAIIFGLQMEHMFCIMSIGDDYD